MRMQLSSLCLIIKIRLIHKCFGFWLALSWRVIYGSRFFLYLKRKGKIKERLLLARRQNAFLSVEPIIGAAHGGH